MSRPAPSVTVTVTVTAPARPALALPPRPAQRRGLWAVPLLLSLLFVAGVLAWLVHTEDVEREQQRQELISDALSLQTQVGSQIDDEDRLLRAAAARVDALPRAAGTTPVAPPGWVGTPEIQQGLHRFWVSLTWLDTANRIVAHLPEQAPHEPPWRANSGPASGLSAHLFVPLADGGALVARYSPSDLLRRTVPWWLARKYDMRLVDSFGDVMASTTDAGERPRATDVPPPPPRGDEQSGKATFAHERPRATDLPPPPPRGDEQSGEATFAHERPRATDLPPPPPRGDEQSGKATFAHERPRATDVPPPPPRGDEQSGKATFAHERPRATDVPPPPPRGDEQSGKATFAHERPRATDVPPPPPRGDEQSGKATFAHDPPARQSHRIAMGPALVDSYLELTARDRITPWYRSFPMTLVAGFVLLIGAITVMLRRQGRDVSRAEANWRTEAAWRSAMEDSLTVGLRARDFDGRLLYVNRTLADLIGYAPEELLGVAPPMPYWPADSLEEILLRHARNMAGQAPRGGYEARWRHREGRLVDVMVFEAPLVDAAGQHIGWMGSILDITEKKRLEERERRQTETVTHHARLTMLGEVASTLAHELNQPLTAISSYNAGVLNSLQRAQPGAATDPAVLRALQRLGEQAAHAGRIVQRIREFLTRREPQLEAGSLNAIVEGGIGLLRRELARQQVRLAVTLDPALPSLVVDAVLIEQVVINLVRNAVDAQADRPPGPGRERRVEVRTLRAPGDPAALRIEVEDGGPGLQGQRIEALCAPFHSTKKDGMGMGLAICRSILEAHQGALDACDVEGGGACFSVTLPIDLRDTVAARESTRPGPVASSPDRLAPAAEAA